VINKKELRIVAVLAGIFALRMLGLCMLLPIFAIEALQYTHATAPLIGLAIGIYGLAQALLQIPFGILSDKYGRKPLILVGLGFIALGSLVAALSTSIYGLILGRILQGCGAMGSVVIALLADQVREQVRTSAMAILGASIGLSFALALILGPWLNQWLGLPGIFVIILVLAIIGSLLLMTVPKSINSWQPQPNVASFKHGIFGMLNNIQLINLNLGVFVLHASLAAIFLILPGMLLRSGINAASVWQLYLVALIVAMLAAWRLIGSSEKRQNTEHLQAVAILGLLIAEGLLYTLDSWLGIAGSLIIFFTAFCVLEASLPMLVSKYAPAKNRGAALGVYSCLQFLGMFVGGVVGGWLHGSFGAVTVLGFCILLATCWLFLSIQIKKRGVQLWQEV
jgi:MFS family permease